jgi:hypothetical protein
MTNDTIQSLLLSFEDNYHLPLLQEVNKTYITATPESLLTLSDIQSKPSQPLSTSNLCSSFGGA